MAPDGEGSSAAASDPVLAERRGGALWLTLNRPNKLNAIGPDSVAALDRALNDLESSDRCVVITGAGRAFSAGGDLDAVLGLVGAEIDARRIEAFHRSITDLLRRLERLPLPVIAAVNGLAVAGGLEIAAACDIVVAASDASFGDGHVAYGLVPGGGASVRLPRKIGVNRAKLLMLSGRQVSAATMADWGLVSVLVEPGRLEEEVDGLVGELAARSRDSLREVKQLIDAGLERDFDAALEEEQVVAARHAGSADYIEGLRAFQSKRTPRFAP